MKRTVRQTDGRFLFQHSRSFGEGVVSDFDVHRKISSDFKRWINRDELVFDFLPDRAVFQRGNILHVVIPDKLVCSYRFLLITKVEMTELSAGVFGLFSAEFIEMLYHLQGNVNRAGEFHSVLTAIQWLIMQMNHFAYCQSAGFFKIKPSRFMTVSLNWLSTSFFRPIVREPFAASATD